LHHQLVRGVERGLHRRARAAVVGHHAAAVVAQAMRGVVNGFLMGIRDVGSGPKSVVREQRERRCTGASGDHEYQTWQSFSTRMAALSCEGGCFAPLSID
jgi:hypothetical protein